MLLFLFGCLVARLLLAYIAKQLSPEKLRWAGVAALLFVLSWSVIYVTNSRKTGFEVSGGPIWWDNIRPIHIAMWFMFALFALRGNRDAWVVLLIDAGLGLAFFINHYW